MQTLRDSHHGLACRHVRLTAQLLALLACAVAIIAAPAIAGPTQDWHDCARGNLEQRIRGCTKIIKRGRESKRNLAVAYYNRGLAYHEKGKLDRAIADYDKAVELNPRFAEAYYNRGIAYDEKGEFDRAIADYDRAIQLNPKFPDAYGNRGVAYEKRGERKKAIADFRKALALRPGDRVGTAGLKRLGITP